MKLHKVTTLFYTD